MFYKSIGLYFPVPVAGSFTAGINVSGGWNSFTLFDIQRRGKIKKTTMLANSEFVDLLKQANTDSSKMAEVIGVSEAQLRFV